MAAQITELLFLEHLAPQFNIPVPEYLAADATNAQIRDAFKRWQGKGLVKPDVLVGKRGKAGSIRLLTDYVEAQKSLKREQALEVNGHLPRTTYLVEYIPAEFEVYSAITYDSRYLGPSITVSMVGGVDIEDVSEDQKITLPIDVYRGLDAYQAGEILKKLGCPANVISLLSRSLVDFWDMFISTGMRMCEINPWRITVEGRPYACDFKAVFDEANFKFNNLSFQIPEYPATITSFEEEMAVWNAASHQGQAHVAELGGDMILPILFGGGASTIIIETLIQNGGNPIFLSDFGGNPPYERMFGSARICFEHHLAKAKLVLILGGKANNTLIDITFKAIADALQAYVDEHGSVTTPVIIGRGGPGLVQGLLAMRDTLESLGLPYVIYGPDTPVTLVAEYAAKFANACCRREVAG
jgi:succinyl-CoA synthetase beta subunit